jgi:hypothetical protein
MQAKKFFILGKLISAAPAVDAQGIDHASVEPPHLLFVPLN